MTMDDVSYPHITDSDSKEHYTTPVINKVLEPGETLGKTFYLGVFPNLEIPCL